MKNITIKHIFAATVAATALLLAGCRQEKLKQPSPQKEVEIQNLASIDTAATDKEHHHRIVLIKSTRTDRYSEK